MFLFMSLLVFEVYFKTYIHINIHIEIDRFENKPQEERKCPFCDEVENESHVVLSCYLYDDLRIA